MMPKMSVVILLSLLSGCGIIENVTSEKRAKGAVEAMLLDPNSAEFRNVHVATVTSNGGSRIKSVCGEVNSKNLMGGYAGFEPFLYVIERNYSPREIANGAPAKGRVVRPRSYPWMVGEAWISDSDHPNGQQNIEDHCRDGSMLSDETIAGFAWG